VKSRLDGFEWILVGVHGAAQEAVKPDFLAKLVRICESETLPMLVGVILILLGEMKRK
jgi:hypothetical protein